MIPDGFVSSKRKAAKPAAKRSKPAPKEVALRPTPIRVPPKKINPAHGGPPAHVPTAELRRQVEQLAGLGNSIDGIASVLTITPDALRAHYGDELMKGPARANSQVAAALFKRATKDGHVEAQKFWLKARAGWKENLGLVGADGGAIRIVLSADDAAL
jgi:hypothetical protein